MKQTGLQQKDTDLLRSIFRNYPDIQQVVLFGSRAKGTACANSDIDLAVWGIENDLRITALSMELDELPLPYKFDVKAFSSIRDLALRQHIERVGVVIYKTDGGGVREKQTVNNKNQHGWK